MMKGLMKKVRGNKKGFTLAELLVVVAIVISFRMKIDKRL